MNRPRLTTKVARGLQRVYSYALSDIEIAVDEGSIGRAEQEDAYAALEYVRQLAAWQIARDTPGKRKEA